MMEVYLYMIGVSLVSFFCISILFKRYGLVDKPDGVRKIHEGEISLGGGIALFLPIVIFLFFFFEGDLSFSYTPLLMILFYVSTIILLLGLYDDIKPLPFSARLIVQIFASWLVIILTDIHIIDLGNLLGFGSLYLSKLGIPVTIFMVVGVCNAFNMIDGMDGLVGIVILVSISAISLMATLTGVGGNYLFLGSVLFLIFLLFNLGLLGRRWKIFLGDSGSMWIGFMMAWFLVILSQGEERLFQPVTALWFILLPLIDALSTFLTRLWNRKSMFHSDRTHIHHMLLDSGLNKWKVLLVFLIISILSAVFGIFANINSIPEPEQFYGFLTIWFFYFLLVKYPLVSNKNKRDNDI